MIIRDRIVLAVGVYDNADILRDFIEWYYQLGIDFVVAYDYGSADGSRDILDEFARRKLVDWMTIPATNYARFDPFANIALRARDQFAADWIVVVDTDEFICPPEQGLRAALATALSDDITSVTVPSFNMTGQPLSAGASAVAELTLRIDRPLHETEAQAVSGALPVPYILMRQQAKTIVRADALIGYTIGAHTAIHAFGRIAVLPGLSMRHYPIRGYDAFQAKVRNCAAWLTQNPEFTPGQAWHWRRWVREYQAGRLREEYDAQFVSPERAAELLRGGVCTRDEIVSSWVRARKD